MATQMHFQLSKTIRHCSVFPRYNPLPQWRSYSSKPSGPKTGEAPSARESTSPSDTKIEKPSQSEESENSKSSPNAAKTVAQSDEELREKLESMCGGGGEAALELENGKPVTMKRGVRENMFRLI